MEMTGGEAVVSALEMLGVRHVFGIVSVHNLPIYDAIARRGTITPIGVRHEQAAAHAADGYARATGELGVVIASTGPGTTNTMTGLFEASFASSPVLLITGQIDSSYLGKAKGFLHKAEHQRLMLSWLALRVETVRRTEDMGGPSSPWPRTSARAGLSQEQWKSRSTSSTAGPRSLSRACGRTPLTSPTRTPWLRWPRRSRPRPGRCCGPGAVRQLGRRTCAGGAGRAPRRPGRHHGRGPRLDPRGPPAVPGRADHQPAGRGHRVQR